MVVFLGGADLEMELAQKRSKKGGAGLALHPTVFALDKL